MLSISHAVTGAFIATKVTNPVIAIPLIFLSHYMEDAIPHWDAGTGLGKGVKSPRLALRHEYLDLVLAAIFVLLYFPLSSYDPSSLPSHLHDPQIWGAFLGLLPDFIEAPRNFWKYEPRWLKPINKFHQSFHHSIPRVLDGLAPQLLLLTLLWFLR
ncbi:MAG: hypothetical protein ABII21_04615 [bacterium]